MLQVEFDPIPREGLELDQLVLHAHSVVMVAGSATKRRRARSAGNVQRYQKLTQWPYL